MNFWQWLYNLLAFVTLPFYITALANLLNRASNVRKMCLACVIYFVETLIGLLYTCYFVYFWFSREDSSPSGYSGKAADAIGLSKREAALDLSQSASQSRELFLTVSGIIVTNAARLYFAFVFLSFTKQLLKQSILNQKSHGAESVDEECLHATSVVGRIKKFVYDLEMRSKLFFTEVFA